MKSIFIVYYLIGYDGGAMMSKEREIEYAEIYYRDTLVVKMDKHLVNSEETFYINKTDMSIVPLRLKIILEKWPDDPDFLELCYKAVQDFLDYRVFPKTRSNCKMILDSIGAPFHSTYEILSRSYGFDTDDFWWVNILPERKLTYADVKRYDPRALWYSD